jgi:hypothetical protein
MQTSTPVVDLHLHPTIKPYGNSFYSNSKAGVFSDFACIWRSDPYSDFDMQIESLLGIARYRQSDFSTLIRGQVQIACVALYPIEKGFFDITQPTLHPYGSYLAQFTSLLGKERIADIQSPNFDYFKDLEKEHNYLELLNGKVPIGGSRFYSIINDNSQLQTAANLLIIPTIEGCHAFCNGSDPKAPDAWDTMESNVKKVKEWEAPPMFVTFAHHFYNGLCTHAKSLFDTVGRLLDQSEGMREYKMPKKDSLEAISTEGQKLIKLLLNNIGERRILIDVKHMSLEARTCYYDLLKNDWENQAIPIIWSHGAVAFDTPFEINIHLETDVMPIYESGGIIGIEMDQRILGYNNNRILKSIVNVCRKRKYESYCQAWYVWRQIIAIAEYVYINKPNQNPWACLAIGSDYDGIINPLNRYRDAGSFPSLYNNLIVYLHQYWKKGGKGRIPKDYLNKNEAAVVYDIMYGNAFQFISNNYK